MDIKIRRCSERLICVFNESEEEADRKEKYSSELCILASSPLISTSTTLPSYVSRLHHLEPAANISPSGKYFLSLHDIHKIKNGSNDHSIFIKRDPHFVQG